MKTRMLALADAPDATASVKTCANCHALPRSGKLITGRCDTCYRWFRKHGVERRVAIGTDPIMPPSESDAQEPVDAQVEPEMQGETSEIRVTLSESTPLVIGGGVFDYYEYTIESGAVSEDTGDAPEMPDYTEELPEEHVSRPVVTAPDTSTSQALPEDDDENRLVSTWTSAHVSYDGFDTQTVVVLAGIYCGKDIRQVTTPLKHLSWQRSRYARGNNTVVGESEWKAIQRSPAFLRDNPPDPAYIAELGAALRDLSDAEPPVPPAVGSLVLPPATTPVLVPFARSDKVQYVLDLVAQGEDAIQTAIQKGRLIIRLPRHAAAPRDTKAPRPAAAAAAARTPDAVSPRQGGFLQTRVTTGSFGKGTHAVRRELFKKGLIANATEMTAALTAQGETIFANFLATLRTPGVLSS